ncbi:MAG: hypothetical protein JST73_04475 [Actinobacteria bacterium]|nr:hypothetical protein [Actinomycetota bacterium]
MLPLLASLTWDPGIRGILDVVIAVSVLCGTPLILLTTNLGARLAVHALATALFGWLTIMFLFWTIYGLGYHGPSAEWKVKELSSAPSAALSKQLHTVPTAADLGKTPEEYLKSNALVAAAFKGRSVAPTMGDVVAADPNVAKELAPKLNGWTLVSSANGTYGDASSVAGAYLVANGFETLKFNSSSDFEIQTVYQRGGKPPRKGDSMFDRVTHRIKNTAMWLVADNPTHYAVVQIQPTIAQTSLPGQPPPAAVVDPNQPVINVLMVRDLGAVRQPAIALTILSLISFLILAYSLHVRDKEGMANRRAAEAAESMA